MTQTTTGGGVVAGSRTARAANIGLWILQALAAAMFAVTGITKLMANAPWVYAFTVMGLGNTAMYAIGALELAGAVALLIPRLAGLAALCFVGLMLGAQVITVAVSGVTPMVALPAFTLAVMAVIGVGRRGSLDALVGVVRR